MWYLIALISGFSFATADAFTKKESKNRSAILLAWIREAYALPFLLPILLFIEIPMLDHIFWVSIISLVLLDLLTTILYMKAIQIAPLSLTIPYQGLTPIFLLIFPTIFLGETLSLLGIIGVIVISIGAYTLQIDRVKYGFFEPWLAIFKNRGSLYMFVVAVLYAVTATLGKLAIQHSSPLFMTIVYFSLLTIGFTPLVILSCKGNLKQLFSHPSGYFRIGISMAIMAITHFTAISMIQVAYMISIKRLSLLFAILYGWWWFKEENIKERILGGIIILVGATCIAFA
jgi:drug/metabolite transporter (DMT)-like permease